MAELLDSEFLARLDYLSIAARDAFLTLANARRMTKRFGIGQEYVDHRDYVAGDDFRYIDWQAYGRLDRLFVKVFSQEEELAVYLLIDCSGSMATGDPLKIRMAKQVAAALGYIALGTEDTVTVVPFDNDVRRRMTPVIGRARRRDLVRTIADLELGGETSLHRSMMRFLAHFKRRGFVIIISDFLDPGYAAALRLLHHARFDCLAIQISARSEVDPELKGDLELIDSESSASLTVRLTRSLRQRYLVERKRHFAELIHLGQRMRFGHFEVVTDQPLDRVMLSLFRGGRVLV
jgi:uncharacterized protein (DUF58 family)